MVFTELVHEFRSNEEECIVEDLMDRYSAGHKGEEDQIIEAMRIDGMKRAVELFRHQQVREFNQRSKAQFVYVGPPRRSLTICMCTCVCVCARWVWCGSVYVCLLYMSA